MNEFNIFNDEDQKYDLVALDSYQEVDSTQIPESTKKTLSKVNSSPWNTIKTFTVAGTFILYLSVNAPTLTFSQISLDQKSPNVMMTEIYNYDKDFDLSNISTEQEVEYIKAASSESQ